MKKLLLDTSKLKEIVANLEEILIRINTITTELYRHPHLQSSWPDIIYRLSKILKPLIDDLPKLRPTLLGKHWWTLVCTSG